MIPQITMSTLGRNGRFGNQIFQYAFLRLYAQKYGLAYRAPVWIGQELFGHKDQPIGDLRLPTFYDQVRQATVLDRLTHPVINVDLCGYFQYHTSYYAPVKRQFRDLFRPVPEIAAPLRQAMSRLRQGDRTLIAIHLRRGDFSGGIHYAAPLAWYQNWLGQNWSRWKNPLLYVASDEPQKVMAGFAGFEPIGTGELGVELASAPYYVDHFALSQADALAISNSSFSFSAAMLNERASEFVRPCRSASALIPFDPWDSDPMMLEATRDEQAAFYEAMHDRIARAVSNFLADPRLAKYQSELRESRRALADLWLGMSDDTMCVVYNTSLAKAQAMLCSPEIRRLERNDEEDRLASYVLSELGRGLGSVWSTQYLLTAMIYCDPCELPMRHDFAHIPQWLVPDYVTYLRTVAKQDPPQPRQNGTAAHLSASPGELQAR